MRKWFGFFLSILVLCADQLSKHWAETTLIPYQPEPLFPMVNFTLAYNTGAAFSFLSSAGSWHHWFFASFSLLMSLGLLIWLIRMPARASLQLLAVALILGGALGNLYDRLFDARVVDFIDVYYKSYHWPIFNLADSAICLGALLLAIALCKNASR